MAVDSLADAGGSVLVDDAVTFEASETVAGDLTAPLCELLGGHALPLLTSNLVPPGALAL
jgi:hypothetical protein